jgi:hypothetical protein
MFESKHFEFSDIPDLSGKTAVITGASTGVSNQLNNRLLSSKQEGLLNCLITISLFVTC